MDSRSMTKTQLAAIERVVASIPDSALLDGPFNCLECGIPDVADLRRWLVDSLMHARLEPTKALKPIRSRSA
ncbi:MAG: hypothetical protein H0U85_04330 [Gemmatimonadales bacterium]|nr:hypothetical protein [Gemmatimonadales bacterium]